VSKIAFGCASFGSSKWQSWVKDEEGLNFFRYSYSNGHSEIVFGKALKHIGARRSRIVIATKVNSPVYQRVDEFGFRDLDKKPEIANGYGSSRKHLFDAVDASLKRLDVDYIDLYQIHRLDNVSRLVCVLFFRTVINRLLKYQETPMEEIMEALHDIVKSGKVRYISASSMSAWKAKYFINR
jgi:aryl-alcohol dehydrogenase-like predicted oxidoreductase